MKGLKKLLRWGNLILILVTFLAYLSPFINPESFSWINILGTAYPWLLLANILFLIFWVLSKNRYFFFSLCTILLGWNHMTSFVGFSLTSSSPTKQSINILTFNTSGFSFLANKDTVKHKQNVKDFLIQSSQNGPIDILCFQEVNSWQSQEVVDKLKFKYEHRIPYHGTNILSKHPIIKTGEVSFKTRTNSCVWADIKIDNKILRVYNIHLKSNQVSTDTERILKKGEIQEKETWSDIKGVFGKFRYTSKIRAQQALLVKAHMATSPYPIILCGDFNETPQSYVYNMLSENMTDTFQKKGFGLGSTYAGSIPALRIDFILADPRFKILDSDILKKKHSDHYPVFAAVELK